MGEKEREKTSQVRGACGTQGATLQGIGLGGEEEKKKRGGSQGQSSTGSRSERRRSTNTAAPQSKEVNQGKISTRSEARNRVNSALRLYRTRKKRRRK